MSTIMHAKAIIPMKRNTPKILDVMLTDVFVVIVNPDYLGCENL